MSIEVMKRIKSLLQDTKMIDSHTISAVVAECDMAILAPQPATTEPAAGVGQSKNRHWSAALADDLVASGDAMRQSITALSQQPATGEPAMDVRCEGCGYMTHHREHMGCVRAAKQHTHPAPSVPATGEPVGEVLSGLVGDIGVEVNWLVHGGRPLERGDKLYAQVVPDACEVWGWVIVDKNGAERSTRSRKQDILGGVYYTTAYVDDDLAKADREFAGCAPHRILTLYTQPMSGK